MAVEACAVCGQKLDDSAMLMSERGWVCQSCQAKSQPTEVKGLLSPLAMVGIVAVVLPFFVHVTSSSSVTVNGETSTRSLDYVAIAGGVVGFLAAAGALLSAVRETQQKGARMAIAMLIDLVSIVHLLRGFGLL